MKFFNDCKTIEDVKATYKTLAKKLHPDMGGNTEDMQALNNEYSFVIAKIAAGGTFTQDEINNIIIDNEAYRRAIETIINLPGIVIELVGNWIWVSGNTFGAKDILKDNKFMWASAKKMWFFRTDEYKASNKGAKLDISDIKAKYGCQQVNGAKGRFAIA